MCKGKNQDVKFIYFSVKWRKIVFSTNPTFLGTEPNVISDFFIFSRSFFHHHRHHHTKRTLPQTDDDFFPKELAKAIMNGKTRSEWKLEIGIRYYQVRVSVCKIHRKKILHRWCTLLKRSFLPNPPVSTNSAFIRWSLLVVARTDRQRDVNNTTSKMWLNNPVIPFAVLLLCSAMRS